MEEKEGSEPCEKPKPAKRNQEERVRARREERKVRPSILKHKEEEGRLRGLPLILAHTNASERNLDWRRREDFPSGQSEKLSE